MEEARIRVLIVRKRRWSIHDFRRRRTSQNVANYVFRRQDVSSCTFHVLDSKPI